MARLSRGVILDRDTFDRGDIDYASLDRVVERWEAFAVTRPEEVAPRIVDAEVVVTNKVVLDRRALEGARSLALVCIAATGTNNVDLVAAAELGIPVCNVRGYSTRAVSQHVYSLILSLAHRVCDYRDLVRAGAWSRSDSFCLLDFPVADLASRSLGIVGYGDLGRAVAAIAPAFGLEVLIAERKGQAPRPGRLPLEEVFARADILSLHCPLTPDTARLINAETLSRMKRTAWLINTARGGLLDEAALAEALDQGVIEAAALDVLSVEPPPPDHVLLARPRRNLLITPHMAWATLTSRQKLVEEIALNIAAFLDGVPRNRVMP